MKLYAAVKQILESNEQSRNSDKLLIWSVYEKLDIVKEVQYFGDNKAILKQNFLSGNTPSFESITRARRKVQENHPELIATSSQVRRARKQKESTKGMFAYHEKL